MRLAGVIVAALLALSGCTSVLPVGATSAPPTSQSPSAASPLTTLTVGSCTGALAEDGEPTDAIPTVPCTQAHSWEVAAVVGLTTPDYPGEVGLRTLATTECTRAFADYVGVEAAFSPYGVTFVGPSESHWPNPDARKLVCLVGTEVGGLKASLKDHPVVFAETGQCLGEPASGSTTYPLIACDQKHLYEVYASSKFAGKSAPKTTEFDKAYANLCVAGFKKFVGVDLAKSKYEIQYFVLPAELWKTYSDHRLVCSVGSPSGGITGTLEGVKK
jgi:hypothetical protein